MEETIYESPDSTLIEGTDTQAAKLGIRIACWASCVVSFLVLLPVGVSHDSGAFYSFGFGVSGVVASGVVSLPFYLFKYFRKPTPKRVVFLVVLVAYTIASVPLLLKVANA